MAEKVPYICLSCQFRFTRSAGSRLAMKCPNCGSERIKQYKPLNAQHFLNTVE